jgi:predicted kinase
VVTGVPGAGKTTLGTALARELGVPFLSLDSIKEQLYKGDDTRDAYQLRLAAEAELGDNLAAVDGRVVVDIWIAPHRDTARVSSLLLQHSSAVTEIFCRVPAELAVQRYVHRPRSGPHRPADLATLQRIRDAADQFRPLGIGRYVEVDTSTPVDVPSLVERLGDRPRTDGADS